LTFKQAYQEEDITGMNLQGKRILITGGTSGLGLAMARALLSAGARVAVGGRAKSKLDQASAELGRVSGEMLALDLDVRDEKSVGAGLALLGERWSGLDVLVNNAGIGMRTVNPQFLTRPMPFWEVPSEKFRDLIDTNLTGYFLVAKQAVPYFLKQGSGRIINISVNQETMQRTGFIPYGPSRAGTESLSRIMAEDLGPLGIKVNLLLPGGATDTGMVPEEFPSERRAQLLQPDVMAEPILFLCSDAAEDVHNERIVAKDFTQWLAAWQSASKNA
jgi:NAD(P)-dependent dehydrogenase (short-subunit alcohol dehydrogenase family)